MGMLFQSFDPRVQYFDAVIQQITDTGIIDGYFRKALPYANLIYQENVEEHPLILEHFAISMIVCLVGLFLGGLVFATEMGKTSKSKRVKRFLET